MKRLFESRKVLASGTALPVPDIKIIFTKAPYIQYEQILLDKNARQYLETIMVSKKTKKTKNGGSKSTDAKKLRNKCWPGFFRH